MSEPITLVSGFGRCGSSLVMQMLEAGGMPMVGQYPAFEDGRASPKHGDLAWLLGYPGRAVKLLDPQLFDIPRAASPYCVIWCSRDYQEQARSQVKFARLMLGVPTNRHHVRAFARSYVDDKPAAVRSLIAGGCGPLLDIPFEKTLARPHDVAAELVEHCNHLPLNLNAMAAVVRQRSPLCAPGLEMELSLIAGREAMEGKAS